MKHSYDPEPETSVNDAMDGKSSFAFWLCFGVVVFVGLGSIIARHWGMTEHYGKMGGYGHFPLVWIGGFTVYPGYINGLMAFEGGDWMLCFIVATFMLGYFLAANWFAFKNRRTNPIATFGLFYFVSLLLNFFNYIFVAILHV